MNEHAVATLKSIIRDLHASPDADRDALTRRFAEVAHDVTAADIAAAEQEAIEEGVPLESVRKLCDVHLGIFTDEAKQSRTQLAAGHPIAILYDEHDAILDAIRGARRAILDAPDERLDPTALVALIQHTVQVMHAARRYFEKEENALFPIIERYGITRPPAIMWGEHDSLREIFREFQQLGAGELDRAGELLLAAEELLVSHVHKEETVLFPTALSKITDEEWSGIRRDFDEIGYVHPDGGAAPFGGVPADAPSAASAVGRTAGDAATTARDHASAAGPEIRLPSGAFGVRELVAMLNTLPVDLTLVDANDEVAYFSEPPERVFPRARSVIGRNVRNCHPPKSVHVVEEILRSFRAGERDTEEFYLHLGERYIYIRYYALRSQSGDYLGCLEVSQDIAPIQKISGEKRIL